MRVVSDALVGAAMALALVMQASGAADGASQGKRAMITSDAAVKKVCSAKNATPLDLQALAADPRAYDGKCVRVSGLWIGQALYSGLEGYYRLGPVIGAAYDSSYLNHRIGLYASDKIMRRTEHIDAADAEVIGTAGVCADLWSVTETEITMATGYCHYTSGTYLVAQEIRFRPVTLVRQVGDAARAQYGNLVSPPSGWPHLGAVEKLAQRWLKDIQTGNVEDFLALHALDLDEIDLNDKEDDFHQVFRAKKSPFASFRRSSTAPQSAVFVVQSARAGEGKPLPPEDYEAAVCFCREADCTARWPISLADASSAKARPFVCGQFFARTENGETERSARTVIDWRNLQEPDISGAN